MRSGNESKADEIEGRLDVNGIVQSYPNRPQSPVGRVFPSVGKIQRRAVAKLRCAWQLGFASKTMRGNPAPTRQRRAKFFESLADIGFALSYHSKRRKAVTSGGWRGSLWRTLRHSYLTAQLAYV